MTRQGGRRAYVETYGCQMNIADGELMEGVLEASGYEIVAEPAEADVILVNTCAIREHAERRVIGRVAQLSGLKRQRPGLILGVTGCMAQRLGTGLFEKAPHVDLVMGPDGYRGLPDRLEEIAAGARPARHESSGWQPEAVRTSASAPEVHNPKGRLQLAVLDLDAQENYEGLEQRRIEGASAWVPIQRGCNHRCTFCIVPYVRGPEKNRSPADVLDEVATLAERGVTEVTLLGQTVNSYRHGGWSFSRLLREVARVPRIRRVRFTSPHPCDVTEELAEVMATEIAVCEQLHLPVQSGSDRTLRRMLRRYDRRGFLETVEMVRRVVPDVALSTDVIVAFPGETREDFRETLSLLREVRFDDAFTYRYSPRDGTPATRMPVAWAVDEAEAQARLEELIDVARSVQHEVNAGHVGREEEVLVAGEARRKGQVLGRTRRNKVVAFEANPGWIGSYLRVRMESTTGPTFVGRLLQGPNRTDRM